MKKSRLKQIIKEEIEKTLENHLDNYSIYLSTEPIYTSLPIDRLKSVLYSLENELGEDLDDYIIMKNLTRDTKSAGELGWDLSKVKPFDNLESLKSKIKALKEQYIISEGSVKNLQYEFSEIVSQALDREVEVQMAHMMETAVLIVKNEQLEAPLRQEIEDEFNFQTDSNVQIKGHQIKGADTIFILD